MATPEGALAGMTVLDLTQVMAGPFCTMILADLGADVVKVENPESGDQTRASFGQAGTGADSKAFLALNRNKRSVTLDLKSDEGRATFHELVRSADVVVENWRPGVAAKLGVDHATLAPLNPGLIYASVSGFGQTGPYADRPGYDLIAQAMAGVMSVTGEPGDRPVKAGIPIGDLGAGLFTAVGILAAWASRQRTGEGQYVETSLFEAALALSVWESTEFWATGEAPQALGSAHRMSAPYQALATRDGFVTVGANNERLWQRLCRALEVEHLADDPRFATNTDRMEHRAELVVELERRLTEEDTGTWVERLLAAGVPAGPIQDYRQVLEDDPHVKARGMVATVEHPVEGLVPVLGSPLHLSRTPASVRLPPPLLGEHNGEVLASAGAVVSGDECPGTPLHPRPQGEVRSRRDGPVLHIELANPARRNALTWEMYDEMQKLCVAARADPDLRVVVLRGAGEAFAAGTDIAQFTEFSSAADGLDYERRVGAVLADLLAVPVPVLGVVDGPAVGGGLAIAACCDVLVATDRAVFGAPIARTLGNCLAPAVVARLQQRLGAGRTTAMLLTSRTIDAAEAAAAGFVHAVVPPGELDEAAAELTRRIATGAPRTLAGLKEIDRRLAAAGPGDVDADDVLADCYGSADFQEGVAAFVARRRPEWTGR
ncbi:enoyl-CoA hydratase [Pseudonocardia kunmingensis]|uniref:Crotonobetainyl-CoA:carnitine CoA-transferase CaiB-like acyl-CoA transferase n=1 Tax=Pseudonocardia kunmingensis TaxID=630975 RepID=A0A543DWV4_9PSEU|nr:enoyl-CoA hydratase [Pseudonocardia kunmingensis]TQM13818.1 crotonobetainyl-CoA:carnitine CoA-transferase CaiB-like acyl-CoA transferase [Pseudonocardia kunmingensis]